MINIATKLRPFSHTFGSKCLIPGTDIVVEAFPNFLRIGSDEIPVNISSGFTLQQDLERNCVWVFGKNFRKKIEGVSFSNIEKLSFGSHKSQDWDMVLRRMDMAEILPVLYDLGQKSKKGTSIDISNYEEFYRDSFQSIAVPKGHFLREAFEKIRSHFILENGAEMILLPNQIFPHGRLLNIQTQFGTLDIEWAKYKMRRAVFHATKTQEISFPHQFRKKNHLHEKGTMMSGILPLQAGKKVYLDRFFE
ncbi:MAG TPA: hypothetical protein VLE96_02720 [Chlamydiales bacterium]|nr:hypothetical protein [Chlamydiales bacterium]